MKRLSILVFNVNLCGVCVCVCMCLVLICCYDKTLLPNVTQGKASLCNLTGSYSGKSKQELRAESM